MYSAFISSGACLCSFLLATFLLYFFFFSFFFSFCSSSPSTCAALRFLVSLFPSFFLSDKSPVAKECVDVEHI